MCKIRITNFGPIKQGFDSGNGFFEINSLAIFIGNQGAGKSTVAKLFSSLYWVQKALFSQKLTKKEIETQSFLKKLLSYHKINSYLTDRSEIDFIDDFTEIKIRDKKLNIVIKSDNEYVRPQIQYMPSERNLVGVIERFAQLPLLPDSMQDFLSVYDEVINDSEIQDSVLPIENLKIRYNKRKNKVELYEDEYSISLNEAASGFHSSVPLFLVTKYFSDSLKKRRNEYKFKNLSEQKKFIQEFNTQLKALMKKYSNDVPYYNSPADGEIFFSLPVGDEPFFAEPGLHSNDTFTKFMNRKLNSCFYNIIEEPEQNLFPNSQKNIIEFLIECLNVCENNKLLITTHSPYVLETINNCIYADTLQKKGLESDIYVKKENQFPYEKVSAYVVKDGIIKSIKIDDIKQIDPKEIDVCSEEINKIYSKLSDMEFAE